MELPEICQQCPLRKYRHSMKMDNYLLSDQKTPELFKSQCPFCPYKKTAQERVLIIPISMN